MKLGVLTKVSLKGITDPKAMVRAIAPALQNFRNAQHCQKRHPAEIHFAPEELPEVLEIGGLTVLPDEQVRPGHVRVTTIDLPEPASLADELNREKAAFAGKVAEVAYGGG